MPNPLKSSPPAPIQAPGPVQPQPKDRLTVSLWEGKVEGVGGGVGVVYQVVLVIAGICALSLVLAHLRAAPDVSSNRSFDRAAANAAARRGGAPPKAGGDVCPRADIARLV